MGGYIGEVFRKHHGGTWGIDERDPQAPAIELKRGERGMAFPGRVFHRLMGGDENNILQYYDKLIEAVRLDNKDNDAFESNASFAIHPGSNTIN